MRFKEVELDDGDIAWLIRKDSCLHCDDPGCLAACPAPGAIVQYTNGIVDFNQEKCIGCQYCVAGCPFDIPRFDQKTKKVYKCTLCVDRVSAGLEPACVKSCPTGAIKFGGKHEMLDYGLAKVEKLKGRGFENAMLYDPSGVGGLHMMYVVPRGDRLEDYGLPADPQVPGTFFSALSVLRKLGTISVWGGLLASAIFYLRTGRRHTPPEDEAVAEAERLGREPAGDGAAREVPVGATGNGGPGDGAAGAGGASGGTGKPRRGDRAAAAGGGAMSALHVGTASGTNGEAAAAPGFERYTFVERLVHWFVAFTFIALMLSGFALGYPRAGLPVGTVRRRARRCGSSIPGSGSAFTLGVLWMLVSWARDMRMNAGDREWVRRMKTYAGSGHTGLDVGKYNAGQKGYYWFSVIFGLVLLRHRSAAVVPLAAGPRLAARSPASCTTPPSCSWSAAS